MLMLARTITITIIFDTLINWANCNLQLKLTILETLYFFVKFNQNRWGNAVCTYNFSNSTKKRFTRASFNIIMIERRE
jgi:hypothetical protein